MEVVMLEEEFDKYANKYDLTNNNLKSKYNHSYRVMKYMVDYATMLGFNEHDIEVAKIIGLLHDYGRFEQFTRYNSFIDKDTVDHADLSVEELFEKNEIVNYTDLKEEYDLIRFAIKNHNKLSIEETNDDRYIKFAKLIRDADKVDIMYVLTNEIIRKGTDEEITKEVKDCIKEHKAVPRKIVNNENDRILVDFSFAFDLNYDVVLKDYKNGFIEFYNHLVNKEIFKEYFDEVIKYIDERIDNYVRN
jgi:HD superfamily phosphohydrolase YqeK